MESVLVALCRRGGLPENCVNMALEYQRTLNVKKANLGVNNTYQSTVCLHLAAVTRGTSVDVKAMVKLAGAKSKPHYLTVYQNAEKLLALDQTLSVQEICVQLGLSHMADKAAKLLKTYENHLIETFGEGRCNDLNLNKPIFPCGAVHATCKVSEFKLDLPKLCELARGKKKDLLDLSEEMVSLISDKKKVKDNNKDANLLDVLKEEDVEDDNHQSDRKTRVRVKEEDFEDDGYEEWKDAILRKAVSKGFHQFEKYIKV